MDKMVPPSALANADISGVNSAGLILSRFYVKVFVLMLSPDIVKREKRIDFG